MKSSITTRSTLFVRFWFGPSADVPFPIDVDPAADQWRGRITVLHQSRAVQSAILTGPVIDEVVAGRGASIMGVAAADGHRA